MDPSVLIQLPLPPRCKQPEIEGDNAAEDVVVTLLDGKTITGKLYRYVNSEKTITIYQEKIDKEKEIPLVNVRYFQLMNSRHFVPDDKYIGDDKNQVSMPMERQEYQITFEDDKTDMGETMGYVVDDNGLHLFLALAFYNYYHHFIPSTSIKKQRIGPVLGMALVQNKKVSEEDVEHGLKQQDKLRNKKLGEYLTTQEIISPEELQSAIERQQSSPNVRLGEALIQDNLITDDQLNSALEAQKQNRTKPLGEILVNMGAITKEDMKKTLASSSVQSGALGRKKRAKT